MHANVLNLGSQKRPHALQVGWERLEHQIKGGIMVYEALYLCVRPLIIDYCMNHKI
jgi:hypothetical protein